MDYDYECIKRFIWKVDDDDLGLTMKPTPHRNVTEEVDPMKYVVFKVLQVFEKERDDHRKRYKVFVGYGDFEGKFGLGYFCSKTEKDATEKAKKVAFRSVLNTPRALNVCTVDKFRQGRHGATIVTLQPAEKGGLMGTERMPMVRKLLSLAGIKHCIFTCNEPHLAGNLCLAFFDALKQ